MFANRSQPYEPYLPLSMQRQQQAAKNLVRSHQLSRREAEDVLSVISSATIQYPQSYFGREHWFIHKLFTRTVDQLHKAGREAAEGFSPSILSPLKATDQLEEPVMTQKVNRPAPPSLNNFTMTSRTVSVGTKGRRQNKLKIKEPFGASCSLSQKNIPVSAGRAGVLQPSIGERTGALILTLATPLPPLPLAVADTADGSTRLAKLLAGNMAGAIDAAISALDNPNDPAELHAAIRTASQPTWLGAYQDAVFKLRDTQAFDLASAASVTTAVWQGSNLFVTQSGLNTLLLLSYKKVRVLASPALRTNTENIFALAKKPFSATLHNALRQAGSCSGNFFCAQAGELEPITETFPIARYAKETLIFVDRPMPSGCSIDLLKAAELHKLSLAEIAERVAELCIFFGASRDLHVAAFHSPELMTGARLT